ncbi:hypothetical protein OSTOST_04435, partial [Ostertagia ostertagi]
NYIPPAYPPPYYEDPGLIRNIPQPSLPRRAGSEFHSGVMTKLEKMFYHDVHPPTYYGIKILSRMRPSLSVPKTKEFIDENPMEVRLLDDVEPTYYGGYPYGSYSYGGYPYGYTNPVGTGSPWAIGGGLVGNVISFLVG